MISFWFSGKCILSLVLKNHNYQQILLIALVNGEATEASRSDRDMPTDARFKAPQSFAPSPQNVVTKPKVSRY